MSSGQYLVGRGFMVTIELRDSQGLVAGSGGMAKVALVQGSVADMPFGTSPSILDELKDDALLVVKDVDMGNYSPITTTVFEPNGFGYNERLLFAYNILIIEPLVYAVYGTKVYTHVWFYTYDDRVFYKVSAYPCKWG